MDPTINLDEVLDQMINEELEDNTTRRSQRRRVVHRNREEGHDRLFNDYFSKKTCVQRASIPEKVSYAKACVSPNCKCTQQP